MNHIKKTALTGLLILCCCTNYAQNCTDANVASLPGKWELLSSWHDSQDTKSDVLKEKPIADAIIEAIRKNFPWSVVGGRIGYGTFGSNDRRPIPLQKLCKDYSGRIGFNAYGCSAGKTFILESPSGLYVNFNGLPFEFDHSFYMSGPNATDMDKDPETDTYATLHYLPEVKDGYFEYKKEGGGGAPPPTTGLLRRYRTIIKPGKLPYSLMSKKEYYENWKKKNLAEIAVQEAGKKSFEKSFAGDPQLPAMVSQQVQLIAIYQNYINKIDVLLKNKSAEELAQPAYAGDELGEFYESVEATPYKAYIVKPNMAYYNKNISKNSPQVITICQVYGVGLDNDGNKIYDDEKFYNALEKMKIFDFLTEKLTPLIVQ